MKYVRYVSRVFDNLVLTSDNPVTVPSDESLYVSFEWEDKTTSEVALDKFAVYSERKIVYILSRKMNNTPNLEEMRIPL